MKVVRTIADARDELAPLRAGSVGLVPTMGSLHEGHLALLRRGPRRERHRRDEPLREPGTVRRRVTTSRVTRATRSATSDLPARSGADFVFAPSTDEMYPSGFQTWVDVTEVGAILEGRFRPGHFRGVATVVLKLLNVVRPTRVYFGQKDAQQVEVIRRLIADLALEVELRAIPTVRDADGLALSSRNALLSPAERAAALALPRALARRDRAAALAELESSNGLEIDYLEIADFDPPRTRRRGARRFDTPHRQRATGGRRLT